MCGFNSKVVTLITRGTYYYNVRASCAADTSTRGRNFNKIRTRCLPLRIKSNICYKIRISLRRGDLRFSYDVFQVAHRSVSAMTASPTITHWELYNIIISTCTYLGVRIIPQFCVFLIRYSCHINSLILIIYKPYVKMYKFIFEERDNL